MPTNLRSKLAKDMMCMLRFHLSKEFSKRLTLRERETKEHNASACIKKITPIVSQVEMPSNQIATSLLSFEKA